MRARKGKRRTLVASEPVSAARPAALKIPINRSIESLHQNSLATKVSLSSISVRLFGEVEEFPNGGLWGVCVETETNYNI